MLSRSTANIRDWLLNNPGVDQYGDPLPKGVVARIGTNRLWHEPKESEEGINAVVFSPDGSIIAALGADGAVTTWEVPSGRLLHRIADVVRIRAVALSDNGTVLVLVGDDETMRLWSVTERRELSRMERHLVGTIFSSACVASSGNLLAWARDDGVVHIWDSLANIGTHRFEAEGWLCSLCFSPDSQLIAAAGQSHEGGLLCVWSLPGHALVCRINCNPSISSPMCFLQDNKSLIVLEDMQCNGEGAASLVRIWDVVSGKERDRIAFVNNEVACIAVDPGAVTVAVAKLGSLQLWDLGNKERAAVFSGSSEMRSATFSPDGGLLAAGDVYGNICLWAPSRPDYYHIPRHQRAVSAVEFSPKGNRIATCAGWAHVWERDTGVHLFRSQRPVDSFAFSHDGKFFAASCYPEVDCGEQLRDVYVWNEILAEHCVIRNTLASCLALGPSDQTIALGLCNGSIEIRDRMTGGVLQSFSVSGMPIKSLALAKSGAMLASMAADCTISIVESQTGRVVALIDGRCEGREQYDTSFRLLFSKDETSVAWIVGRDAVFACELGKGIGVKTLEAPRFADCRIWPQSLAYELGGRLVACGSVVKEQLITGEMVVWYAETGQVVLRTGEGQGRRNPVLSHNAETLATECGRSVLLLNIGHYQSQEKSDTPG